MTIDATAGGPPTVLAAGGVVLDGPAGAQRVLVVHRPRYDDWSLPKGHVDAGEEPPTAATREVREETGVVATVLRAAGTTTHPVTLADGPAHKRVHWFVMHPDPGAGDPVACATDRVPDAEVDRAEWWPVDVALRDLTHDGERALLDSVVRAA